MTPLERARKREEKDMEDPAMGILVNLAYRLRDARRDLRRLRKLPMPEKGEDAAELIKAKLHALGMELALNKALQAAVSIYWNRED